MSETPILDPMRTALGTIEYQFESIIQRWHSSYTNARLEGVNSIFQAARARARGYRNRRTFITMIYLLAAPLATSQNPFSASKRHQRLLAVPPSNLQYLDWALYGGRLTHKGGIRKLISDRKTRNAILATRSPRAE